MSTNNTTITNADAPFDEPDADFILRSSDNVDFRVYRMFLAYASPVFKDMFALPQVPQSDNSNETKDGLPVVQMTEKKKTVEMLLLRCYPMAAVDPPALEELEDVCALLEAAIKYNVERVEKRVRGGLVAPHFLETDPIRVFAIACRYSLLEEAKVAARATLSQPILSRPYGPELEFMTAGKFYRLLQYHGECVREVQNILTDSGWSDDQFSRCLHCNAWSRVKEKIVGAITDQVPGGEKLAVIVETAMKDVSMCKYCSTGKSLWHKSRQLEM